MIKKISFISVFLFILFAAASSAKTHKVIAEKCVGCTLCVQSCPVKAISMVDKKAVIDPAKCVNCGICEGKCPVKAIVPPPPEKKTSSFTVDSKKCTGCRECVDPCPVKAVSVVRGKAVIDTDKCVSCGLCSKKCRYAAPFKTGI